MGFLRRLYWKMRIRLLPNDKILRSKVLKGDFPKATKFVGSIGNASVIVVESDPGKRMVFSEDGPVCLYFPYVYFVIRYMVSITPKGKAYVFLHMRIGFSNQQLESNNDMVGRLPLSNEMVPFEYCLGRNEPIGPYDSVKELSNAYIDSFWKTAFEISTKYGNYKNWLEATKDGAGFFFVENKLHNETRISYLTGIEHEPFFDYQILPESEKRKPKRSSGNRHNRRKKRKNSVG